MFWIGTATLVLAGVLLATGTRRYFSVQKALFALAVAGTLVLVAVLLLGSRDTFKANLTELTGLDYAGVVATAKQNGYETGSFNLGTSIAFLVFPLLPLLGAVQSIGMGGEVKRVRRSQLFGMLGAVAATGLLIALFDGLAAKAFGYEFQGAIGFNSISGIADGSTEASVGAAPWFTVLAGILTSNVLLATVIMATFVAWIWFWVPAELAYTTRTMIAWSFDRLAPDRLGYVSQRFHTPVVAIGLSTAGAIVFMWLIAYRNIAFLSLIEALVVVWGAAMVAAILFPRTRRELFQASPAAGSRIGRVPVMVVTAAISLAFFALVLYLLWNDPIAAGPMFTLDHLSREFWIVLGHRGVRRGLVPRHPAVPAPAGDRRRPRLPADPDRVMSGQAPRPGWAAVDEAAVALVDEAGARGQVLRLVGSTGIRLHCPPAAAALDRLGRPAKDIDVVCRHEDRKGLRRLLEERGWEVDRDLLVAMEGRRYAFRHLASGLELDVFVDRLEFCHTIELRDRLGARERDRAGRGSPAAEAPDRPPDGHRPDGRGRRCWPPTRWRPGRAPGGRPARRSTPGTWPGCWPATGGSTTPPPPTWPGCATARRATAAAAVVAERVDALLAAIGEAPKSVSWRARARVGERMQWWQDVDDREAVY